MNLRFWISYAVRSLRRSGRRSIFAILCVVVGVAGVVALRTASLTVQNALTSNIRAANGGDISLTTDAAPLSSSDLTIFRRLQRSGRISAWTAVSSLHATAVGYTHGLVPFDVLVVSSPPYPLGGEPSFVSPSNGDVDSSLAQRGDVLVTSVLADELGVHVGGHLLVNGVGGSGLHATVRGILAETSLDHSAAMTINRRDVATVSSGRPHYSAVYMNVAGSPDSVAQSLRSAFPAATVQTVSEALQSAQAQVHDFRQFMLLVGLLALLIAGIGILNAMQSMLAQRRLEIAMLKAMGFPQYTLYALFGGEAVLIGLVGGMLGTALGGGVSKAVSDALARALALQVTFVIDIMTLVAGVGLGIGAAVVFAVLPIVQAAGFRPLEVLREGSEARVSSWFQSLGLLGLVVVLFATLAALTLGDAALAAEFVIGACLIAALIAGGFALILGWVGRLGPSRWAVGFPLLAILAVISVLTSRREPALAAILALATLLWAATVILPRNWLLPLLIAARSLSRRWVRTAVTLVAFLVGVLCMTVTLTVAVSLRGQINDILASTGTTNLVAITNPSSEKQVSGSVRRLPGVKTNQVQTVVQTRPIAIDGRPLVQVIGPGSSGGRSDREDDRARLLGGVTGWDLAQGQVPANISIVGGRPLQPSDAGTNNVIVLDELQTDPYNLALGATIKLREAGTGISKTVRVVGFYNRERRRRHFARFFTPPVYGDRSMAIALGHDDAQSVNALTVDQNDLTHDATSLQHAVPGALVINVGDLTAAVETILGELLNLLAVVTGLVLGAGTAVVANGVALAMLERRRETALFKAVGFGGGSVLQFVLVENALIGTLAGAVSVLATAIFLRLLSRFALQQAIGFDPLLAIVIMAIAISLAVLTAYVTARGPLRMRPLEALRNE